MQFLNYEDITRSPHTTVEIYYILGDTPRTSRRFESDGEGARAKVFAAIFRANKRVGSRRNRITFALTSNEIKFQFLIQPLNKPSKIFATIFCRERGSKRAIHQVANDTKPHLSAAYVCALCMCACMYVCVCV